MRRFRLPATLAFVLAAAGGLEARERWTPEKANTWYQEKPFLAGANFTPSTAINQLEMWQEETFSPEVIDRELGLAESLGFNSMRVFLHHLLWEQDREGFVERVDRFLSISDRHRIGVMFVLLDGVWDPNPRLGRQREPRPHVHNSGWVQSPGAGILADPGRHDELRPYIYGIVHRYRDDPRIQAWDVFNEPDNRNEGSYGEAELKDKPEKSAMLLKKVFQWAREAEPSQPLTAGVWMGPWPADRPLAPIEALMLEESDVVSFHSYGGLEEVKERVDQLRRYGRPILCTEYMARPRGSRFDPILQYFDDERVAAYNWGLVSGKTQTIYPWDSWTKRYTAEPDVWFHDIFRPDGSPYDAEEVRYLRSILGPEKREWIQLFDGKTLDGWTPKIRGYESGVNYGNTFRVENGLLKVAYDEEAYGSFEDRFGHLFYDEPFSHYVVAVEYRFVGEQAPGAPDWALRNSGIMVHGQTPRSMPKDQDFPISIEVQLLGGDGENERTTANLCTPGTHVVMEGNLVTEHCIDSRSKTYHGNQWVRVEAEVRGDGLVIHRVNGEEVLRYEKPQVGGGVVSGYDPKAKRDGEILSSGTISLQSESHPIEFRKVELLNLVGCTDPGALNYKSYFEKSDPGSCRYR